MHIRKITTIYFMDLSKSYYTFFLLICVVSQAFSNKRVSLFSNFLYKMFNSTYSNLLKKTMFTQCYIFKRLTHISFCDIFWDINKQTQIRYLSLWHLIKVSTMCKQNVLLKFAI